ncbi:MAG: leucine-rich repeat domain-containing protein [Eubacteriales bacterium]|nr:leucine-rich repeat domain-containing protein [Eubacteriales bacterium]
MKKKGILAILFMMLCMLAVLPAEAAVKRPGTVKTVVVKSSKNSLSLTCNNTKNVKYVYAYSTNYAQLKKVPNYSVKAVAGVKYLKNAKSTAKIPNLKAGQLYYVKVCMYKTVNGKRVYGKWSRIFDFPTAQTKTGSMERTYKLSTFTHVDTSAFTVYYLPEWAEKFISMPSKYKSTYKVKMTGGSGTVFVVQGTKMKVSKTGEVSGDMDSDIYKDAEGLQRIALSTLAEEAGGNEEGQMLVFVSANGRFYKITANVENYAYLYSDKKIDEYIKANIKSGMSGYEKLEAICKYVASFNYDAIYAGSSSMVITGGGDCIASTSLVIRMCEKVGLTAYSRNARMDSGAGNGHVNAVVKIGSKYYIAETGIAMEAPRYYHISEYNTPAYYRITKTDSGEYATLVSYFGTGSKFEVPATYEGVPVTTIGKEAFAFKSALKEVVLPDTITTIELGAFQGCDKLKTLHIPKSVTEMSLFAFFSSPNLTNFSIDSANKTYAFKDGVIYNKAMTKTLMSVAIPKGKCSIASGTKEIGEYTFYFNRTLTSVTLPSSVRTIGKGAFKYSYLKSVKFPKGLKTIEEDAFDCFYLEEVEVPKGTKIAEDAFASNVKVIRK